MTKAKTGPSISDIMALCKRTAMVMPSAELYGSVAGFWDYGPAGVEIKNRIKSEWWRCFVAQRSDVVGMDGSIITHPSVWRASGHAESFTDPLFDCAKCKARVRGDELVEERLGISADGIPPERLAELMKEHNIRCPKCGSPLRMARDFNLMFTTTIGSGEPAYLRPETAQLIFINFPHIAKAARMKLPFGIAQIGRAFRNEISPRNFLFRSREFEQMEIEFFVHPERRDDAPLGNRHAKLKVNILTAEAQAHGKEHEAVRFGDAVAHGLFPSKWHAYWLAEQYLWYLDYGLSPSKLRLREHSKSELAHYAAACYDIEYCFAFGWKEIYGNADRGTFDLDQHAKHSKHSVAIDDASGKVVPYVAAEPSLGVDRAFLAFIADGYTQLGDRFFLRIDPRLAPAVCLVAPLMAKDKLDKKAKEIYDLLRARFSVIYDEGGSIGKRYARADEIGIPFAITVDYDTLKRGSVTLRDRDTTKQKRVAIAKLGDTLTKLIAGGKLGK